MEETFYWQPSCRPALLSLARWLGSHACCLVGAWTSGHVTPYQAGRRGQGKGARSSPFPQGGGTVRNCCLSLIVHFCTSFLGLLQQFHNLGGWKSEIQASEAGAALPLKAWGEDISWLSGFWCGQQSLPFLGLQTHQSNLCHCPHTIFSLCVLSSVSLLFL